MKQESPGEKRAFFISYNSADESWAEWIAWQLEEAGYTTIIQVWDFRPGGNFVLDMQQAAVEAERTIAVLSQDYLDALYTNPEWAAAFAQDPTGKKKTLLPVRIAECKLEGLLSQIVYIDLVGSVEAEAKEKLFAGIKTGRAKPSVAPSFPGQASVPDSSLHQTSPPEFPGKTHRQNNLEDMPKAKLEMRCKNTTKSYTIVKPITIIGRAKNCHLEIPDTCDNVERYHTTITYKDGQFFITDGVRGHASRLGTFVNGTRVKAGVQTALHTGDSIVLGGFRNLEILELSRGACEIVLEVAFLGDSTTLP